MSVEDVDQEICEKLQKECTIKPNHKLACPIVNGYPLFATDEQIEDKCKVFERIGYDDSVGPTYLAIDNKQKELVLRVGNRQNTIVNMEYYFLKETEDLGHWRMFSQFHSYWETEEYKFLLLYFREGPTLQECLDFKKGSFGHSTSARLAADMLKIVKTVHDLGFLVGSLDPEAFHFDACSRHLFMADISTLRKIKKENAWLGGLKFAPLSVHRERKITTRDELEAWFYVFLSMIQPLPWDEDNEKEMAWKKMKEIDTMNFIQHLPKTFEGIFKMIREKSSGEQFSNDEYDKVFKYLKEIHVFAGFYEDNDNMDFEEKSPPEIHPEDFQEVIID